MRLVIDSNVFVSGKEVDSFRGLKQLKGRT